MWSLIDHHLHVDSPLHRWHPTAKLVGIAGLIIAAAFVTAPLAVAALLLLAGGLLLLSRLPLAVIWRRLRGILLFLLLFAVLLAVTAGEPEAPLSLSFSAAGLRLGALVAGKAVAIALLAVGLLGTTSFAALCRALRRLGCPQRLVHVLLMTWRMNFALAGELESMSMALSARGFRWRLGRRALATAGCAVGSLLVRSLERADRLYDAMLARGYDGRLRTLGTASMRSVDVLMMIAALLLAGGIALVPR